MTSNINGSISIMKDLRLKKALELFNSGNWYQAHDLLEELWHESNPVERVTLQGFLQIAVAQLHLEKGNYSGATILYGEGLGRLKREGIPDLGIDLKVLCVTLGNRLRLLQNNEKLLDTPPPMLFKIDK